MSENPSRVFRRQGTLGHKGAVLALVGLSYIVKASAIAYAGWWSLPQLPGAYMMLPVWARFTVWFVPGVLAVLLAYHPRWQRFGFGLAAAPLFGAAGLWAMAFVWRGVSAVVWGNIDGPNVYGTAASAIQYIVAALILATCARWPDPRVPLKGVERE